MSNTNLTSDQEVIQQRGGGRHQTNFGVISAMAGNFIAPGDGGIGNARLQALQATPQQLHQASFSASEQQVLQPSSFQAQPQIIQKQQVSQGLTPGMNMTSERVGKLNEQEVIRDSKNIQKREVVRQQTQFTSTDSRQVTSSNTNNRQLPKPENTKPQGLVETFYKKVNITGGNRNGISLHKFERIAQDLLNTSGKEAV